jgi:hypothetical protein
MATLVADGATLQCSMGLAPGMLHATERPLAVDGRPLATVADHAPVVNIASFGMCRSTSNPQVIAATSAAQGVLTPQPCVPVTSSPWTGGSAHLSYDNQAALTSSSTCDCQWAGSISVKDPGNTRASDD